MLQMDVLSFSHHSSDSLEITHPQVSSLMVIKNFVEYDFDTEMINEFRVTMQSARKNHEIASPPTEQRIGLGLRLQLLVASDRVSSVLAVGQPHP